MIPLFLLGLSSVSAEETQTGSLNTSPSAINDTVTTNEDTSVEINLTANDTDLENDTLIVTWISNIVNWTWVVNWTWTGVLFTPSQNFNWTWSFQYIVSDWLLTDTWSVFINVVPVNDIPVAMDDTITVSANSTKTIDPRNNDTDVDLDILAITWTTLASHWTVTFTNVSLTYVPNLNYYWNDNFSYTVSDWKWWSDIWMVNVKVKMNNNDENNDWDQPINKYVVKIIQKEYISKFKELKSEYKNKMKNKKFRNEYLVLKRELRAEYLMKLKEVIWKR